MSAAALKASGSLAALGQRPPRLVLRVILYSALTLGIGAATLLVFIRHFERERAEHTATLEASVVTQVVVDRLRPTDLRYSPSEARRRELDELFRVRVLDEVTLAAAIVTGDARVVYASDPGPIDSRARLRSNLAKARAGIVSGEVVSASIGADRKKVLRTYAPFRLADGSTGAVVVDKDYAQIAASARQAAITVAAVLELALIALWLCLIPIMRTVTKRIHRQLDTIAHMALHDELTGLPNRTQLGSRLDDLLADDRDHRFSVLFIDLDRFKEVNDTLGHDRGNDLLVEISKRLDAGLRHGELVARLGGDEFAVISERAVDAGAALALGERLRSVIAELFEIAGISIEPQASIGIALAPEHGKTRDDLLRRADIAMYAAKRSGVPQVFASELDDHSPVRLAMSGELRRALEGGELVVYYQPQYDLVQGKVRGAEALVRWLHPTRGLLEPKEFLAAVEHTGLMRQLTRLVLDESLRQLRSWREFGLELTLAVNISQQDLADARFPHDLVNALVKHGIEPSALELEITENVLLSENVQTAKRLEHIVDQGIRVAIDDFGVGYSSLGHLKDLPARVLKIDQSFVSGMTSDARDAAIVRSTIELAHRLGLQVVAEGVETRELMTQLRDVGCDIVQGYYLGRPLPFGKYSDWVALTEHVETTPIGQDGRVVPLRRASG